MEYATPEKANDFTLFAGYDLESQVWADLRAAGSRINIDSPVIVSRRTNFPAYPDIDLRATTVTIDARVSSTNDLFVGASRSGAVTETLAVNAAVRVPREAKIYIEDEQLTTPTATGDRRGPDRGKLLISQTGSIAATFYTNAPQFGNGGVPTVATEIEPNDDGVVGGSVADLARANDLSGSFVPLGNNIFQATVTGTISAGNDRDWDFFKVPLRANDIMEVSLVGLGLSDPYVRLFNAAAGQIAADDDSGAGLNSYLTYVNGNTDADFYIAADSFGSYTGSYQLTVTVRGSYATPTTTILVTAVKSDVLIEGTVFGLSQSYLMRSAEVNASLNAAPYYLTTKSQRTGVNSGIIRGDTLQAILANDADTPLDLSIAYNVVDLNTAVNSLRVRASVRQNGVETSPSGPFPYQLTLREENAVSIDAVAASTLPISIKSDGAITWTSSLNTAGDIVITTKNVGNTLNAFVCSAPITTTNGKITITASDIAVGSSLIVSDAAPRSPDRTDIVLDAGNGNVTLTGLVQSPNRIRIGQTTPGLKAGRVSGSGKVKTRDLFLNAVTVGNPEADPRSEQFFLHTEVDSLQGDIKNGAAIDEVDDIAITQLRSPAGLVALRAGGADHRAGSPNAIALTANLRDVVNLFVSAPDGSILVRNDSAERLQLGMRQPLELGTVESMKAAGNVSIVSTAGGIDVLDAPFGGSGASTVLAHTTGALTGTYDAGIPGQRASTIRGVGAIAALVAPGQPFEKAARQLNVNDRVLVSRGVGVGGGALIANGIYAVTNAGVSGGDSSNGWVLTRVADADTYDEFPSSTIVYAGDTDEYFVCTHAMTSAADFGTSPITVAGFTPSTQIGVAVVVPQNDIRYVVSSTGGTNAAAGSLGKMLTVAQVNQPGDADQRQSFAFSSTLSGTIVLTQQLPEITRPLQIDGNIRWPAVTTDATPAGPIAVNGQFITTLSRGGELYSRTASATVKKADPFRLLLPAAFSDAKSLQVGMPATGVGISSGARIVSVTPNPVSGNTEVVLDRIASTTFDAGGAGTVSVTFSTSLDGLRFAAGSDNAAVGNISIGGFENGAAIAVAAQNVSITRVTVGSDPDGNRLANTNGILVTGSATVTGGSVVSSTAAGVQTGSAGRLTLVGTTIGLEKLANVEGVRIGGTGGFTLGKADAAGTVVQFNRVGMVIENGANQIVNTTIANNSYDGIVIEGGESTIGPAAAAGGAVVSGRNAIFSNGGWGVVISGRPADNDAARISVLAGRQEIRQNLFLSPKDVPGALPSSNRRGAIGLSSTGAANPGYTVSDYSATNTLHRVANGVDAKGNRYIAIPDTVGPVLLVAAAYGVADNNLLESDNRTVKGTNANLVRAFVLTLKDDASGVAGDSVVPQAFDVSVGGRSLVPGVDYRFSFSGVDSGEIRFTTLSGTGYFAQGEYTITATAQARAGAAGGRLVDSAGNMLQGDAATAVTAKRVFVLADVPGVPTNVNGVAEGTGVRLTWDAPQISVIPITNYIVQYKKSDAVSWTTAAHPESPARSLLVPDLELGVGYSFRVAAVNAAGAGDFSTPTPLVTPRSLASAPRDLQAVAGDRSVVLTWTVPTSDGGDVITSYIVEQSGDAGRTWATVNNAVTMTTLTVDHLDNGTSYKFRVAAQTASGRGASAETSAVVPVALPDRVVNLRATAGNNRVTLNWVAPNANGSPITDYAVQSSTDNGVTWVDVVDGVSSATTAVITGLVNGTAYQFRVAAVNVAGTAPYSDATGVVRPGIVPLAPINLQAAPGEGRVVLTWSRPGAEGDAAINDYVVESSQDGGVTWVGVDDGVGTATTATATGLTNGSAYLFRVAAVSVIGQSDWAVVGPVVPAAAPGEPTGVTAALVNGQVVVNWTAPSASGGSPITDYVLQASSNGGISWQTVADGQSTATTATVPNLAVGVSYTFRVAAVNQVGSGAFSSASSPLTVVASPEPVGSLVVVAAARSATLSWTTPRSTGGRPVADYLIEFRTADSAFWTVVARPRSTATSGVVVGLVPGTGYFFRVTAITDYGRSTPTATTTAIIPMNAPTRLSGRVVGSTISLGWVAPRPPAGSRIVNYQIQYSTDAGATWTTVQRAASSAPRGVAYGLPRGTYMFRVAAVTNVGVGTYSANSGLFRVVR